VLRDWRFDPLRRTWVELDPHSKAGRKAVALFH